MSTNKIEKRITRGRSQGSETDSGQTGESDSRLPITLDFGGPLGQTETCRTGNGFGPAPKTPHDPFKMKPPGYPSLF